MAASSCAYVTSNQTGEDLRPQQDGSYWLEMRQSDGQSLVVSVPASEAAVLRYFQRLKTNGFVPQLRKR